MNPAIEEQINEAKRVIDKNRYTVSAVIKQTNLGDGKSVFGFHFEEGRSVGDVIKHADRTTAKVVAIVSPCHRVTENLKQTSQ